MAVGYFFRRPAKLSIRRNYCTERGYRLGGVWLVKRGKIRFKWIYYIIYLVFHASTRFILFRRYFHSTKKTTVNEKGTWIQFQLTVA